jgi:cyclase
MKRAYVLAAIVAVGALATAVAELGAQAAPAGQGERQGAPGARGGGRGGPGGGGVGTIEKVADNLYSIPGAGGNTGVFVTAKGVVLVDTKLANNGQAILDQVQSVTKLPVTHIINTHTHGDHVGSNAFFPATVEIVTQENTAANMKKLKDFAEAANQHGLPDRTYTDRLTLLSGNDAIELYHFGPAHTNGDTFVVFRNARVMHAGDVFAQKGAPIVDVNNGGHAVQYGDTIAKAAAGIKGVERVIPGHITGEGFVQTWQDFVDYGEFNRAMVDHARASMKAGRTPEEALKTFTIPERFKGYTQPGPGRGGTPAGGNFTILYEQLKGSN